MHVFMEMDIKETAQKLVHNKKQNPPPCGLQQSEVSKYYNDLIALVAKRCLKYTRHFSWRWGQWEKVC